MYKILLLIIFFLIYFKNKYKEKFITGLPKRTTKAYRNYNIKLFSRYPHEKNYENKISETQKLMNLYLNEISEPLSYNNNILPSSIYLHNIKNDKGTESLNNKYNNIKDVLKLLIDKKTNIKEFKKNQKLFFSKNNAIDIAKNFVIKFNNFSNFTIEFVKIIDLYKRRLINNNDVLYIITFYIKIPNFKNVFQILLVCEINKNDEITYNNKFDNNHIMNILNNIIHSHLIGSNSHSDISFGTENKYNNYYKYQIDFNGNLNFLLNENEIKNILKKRENQKNNSNKVPIYNNYDFNEGLIKINDKCIDNNNNKWILNDCNKTKSIFIKDKNDNFKINNDFVLSYHNDNNFTYSPYNSEYICNNNNNNNQNCNKFKFKKFGGLEIIGLNNKCLNYKNNKWSKINCKDGPKAEFIYTPKEKKIKNNINGKIKIKDKCLYIDNISNGKLVECENGTNFIHNNNNFISGENKCLTFYHNGKINNTDCKIKETCENNNLSQVCKKFKFENRNGFQVIGRNKCLNTNLEEVYCENAPNAEFITN